MQEGEGIDPFLTKVQYIQDELAVVGEAPQDIELMCLALNNVAEGWEICVQGSFG